MVIDPATIRWENLKPYIALMEKLVAGEKSLAQFENSYFDLFKNDPTMWADAEFRVIGPLFSDLDSYYADPNLRDAGDLDEAQMRARVPKALESLKDIIRDLVNQLSY